jgi:tryptophan synthase alpha chain
VKAGERIERAIRGRPNPAEPALLGYLTAGYPSRERFAADVAAIAAAADVLEIGVPFTDPMADGVTIQRASHAALKAGVTLGWILDQLASLPRDPPPVLLMSYLNPLLAFGLHRLPSAAARARVSGFIVPDLPYEECADLRAALAQEHLALVQMVTPVTPATRLRKLAEASSGFLYAVTITGTTGRNVAVPDDLVEYLDRVRAASPLPVCAGFGIRSRAQVERLRGHVDGAVVGSALVEVLERNESPTAFLRTLRGT